MPTIAIVGAGPGLGLAIAHAFGSRGFGVALIARMRAAICRAPPSVLAADSRRRQHDSHMLAADDGSEKEDREHDGERLVVQARSEAHQEA